MKIPQDFKKCVAFVALQMADQSFRLCGTVFFVNRDNSKNKLSYAVTAKHILDGIKRKGLEEIMFRINLKNNSSTWIKSHLSAWKIPEDPNVDIAILPMTFMEDYDHLVFPMSLALNSNIISTNEIDVGDEVFITGLFVHHHGVNKNIPIVRIGNIAAMPGEKIQTREQSMDAYLIEARSIGGLSGSPVFVNLGVSRLLAGRVQHASGPMLYLSGIIYGHYDVTTDQIDNSIEDSTKIEKVNTGIAIVTPIEKLEELFCSTKVIELESIIINLRMNKSL
jgi:hypothetical protein